MAKSVKNYTHAWLALAVTRIALGFVFVWAFLDKLLGLGYATAADKSWLAGVSPTSGFLLKGVNPHSPLHAFFNGLAGQPWVDWLFMIGLLGIGVALMLGIGLRAAAVAGTFLLWMMWAAVVPSANNPLIDDHIIYIGVLWTVAAGRRELSLASWWISQPFVKKQPWLW